MKIKESTLQWSLDHVLELNKECNNTRNIALERIRKNGTVAALAVKMLREATDAWRCAIKENTEVNEEKKSDEDLLLTSQPIIANLNENNILQSVLELHSNISRFDPILSDEIGKEGGHTYISFIIKLDLDMKYNICQEDFDAISYLKDLACDIASACSSFPMKYLPFSKEELMNRLPISFEVSPLVKCLEHNSIDYYTNEILMNQVTSRQTAQEDVGFVLWPSSIILAKWIRTNPDSILNKDVLELGAGCGLVGITAASSKTSRSVVLTDFNDTVLANLKYNLSLNDVASHARVKKLDFYDVPSPVQQQNKVDRSHKPVKEDDREDTTNYVQCEEFDTIFAADVICKPSDAVAVSKVIRHYLKQGGDAIVICADSNHRFGVEIFVNECQKVGLVISSDDVCNIFGCEMFNDKELELASGYVEGMNFKLFHVTKL